MQHAFSEFDAWLDENGALESKHPREPAPAYSLKWLPRSKPL